MYNINSVVGVIVVKNDQLKHVSLEDINNQFFFSDNEKIRSQSYRYTG